jgi:hypothetical protein
MFYRTMALAGVVLALSFTASRADDAYVIKINRDDKGGEKYQITTTHAGTTTNEVTTKDGKVLNQAKEVIDNTTSFVKTIIAMKSGSKQASKVELKFDKVSHKKNSEAVELGLAGKTVTAELKGEEYDCKIQGGGDLNEAALKFIKDEMLHEGENPDDFEKAILPKQAVKVGETWTTQLEGMAKTMEKKMGGIKIDLAKAKGSGKLLKVSKTPDGHTYGNFELTLDLPFAKAAQAGGADLKLEDGSKIKFVFNFDGCIDGSRQEGTMNGTVETKITGELNAGGMELQISSTGNVKLSEVRKDLTGK